MKSRTYYGIYDTKTDKLYRYHVETDEFFERIYSVPESYDIHFNMLFATRNEAVDNLNQLISYKSIYKNCKIVELTLTFANFPVVSDSPRVKEMFDLLGKSIVANSKDIRSRAT